MSSHPVNNFNVVNSVFFHRTTLTHHLYPKPIQFHFIIFVLHKYCPIATFDVEFGGESIDDECRLDTWELTGTKSLNSEQSHLIRNKVVSFEKSLLIRKKVILNSEQSPN